MGNKSMPQIESLLSLLDQIPKDHGLISLSDAKALAELLEPLLDKEAISILFEKLDHSDHDVRDNILKVLAVSADPQLTLPLLRYAEIRRGYLSDDLEILRMGLLGKDDITRQKVNEQLIKYLREGPFIGKKTFKGFASGLMKDSNAAELAGAEQKHVIEHEQTWNEENSAIQYFIVRIFKILSQFDGLNDPELEILLPNLIRKYGFDSFITQLSLVLLSKIKSSLAAAQMNDLTKPSLSYKDTIVKEALALKIDSSTIPCEFAVYVRVFDTEELSERAYYFIHEQNSVFLLTRRSAIEKWYVGEAQDKNSATELAISYLERWARNINSLVQIEDRYSECMRVVKQFIDFEEWGFQLENIWQVYELPYERPQIIYQSKQCKIKISFRSYNERNDQSDVLNITYGRLHAADKDYAILWNGEMHNCWHRVSPALCFLDGMSPENAAKFLLKHPLISEYEASHSGSQPAMESEIHAIIWERYSQRLFQLFDLRYPDLWEKYSTFIKQISEIKDLKYYSHGVPYEKIC